MKVKHIIVRWNKRKLLRNPSRKSSASVQNWGVSTISELTEFIESLEGEAGDCFHWIKIELEGDKL